MTTVLVTCSRSWTEWSTMRAVLEETYARVPDAVLLHGDAENGDRQAAGMWRQLGGTDKPMPADWATCVLACRPGHRKVRQKTGEPYCPDAGHRRNREMVETAPELVLAFIDPQSKTKGAVRTAEYAEEAGLTVVPYMQGDPL